jgi:hypothetical protein
MDASLRYASAIDRPKQAAFNFPSARRSFNDVKGRSEA